MSDFDRKLRKLLSVHEGRVASAYTDSLGFITIGVGRLIDKRKGGRLSEAEIDYLLDNDIRRHSAELLVNEPWIKDLDDVRRAVVFDMAFNMGSGFLAKWPKFVAQLKAKQWSDAAFNMLNSLWAQQVGARATRLATMMAGGQWPPEAT